MNTKNQFFVNYSSKKTIIRFQNTLYLLFLSCLITFPSMSHAQSNSIEISKELSTVYEKYKHEKEGKNPDYIPELAKVNPNYFGIVIATVDGKIEATGDSNVPFAIESVVKPFLYALALKENGSVVNEKIGLNGAGYEFNSVLSIEKKSDHRQNAMTNTGAIQSSSYIQEKNLSEKWDKTLNFVRKLSDGKPFLGEAVYRSESNTNLRNKAITNLLTSYGMIQSNGEEALDLYTRACSIMVTAKQLAMMGATLENGGIHPKTKEKLLAPEQIRDILSQMTINGFYEDSGQWWTEVGLPSKSGVGGGILSIIPGKMAIVTFAPPLDKTGNSVKGQKAIKALSQHWNLHLLSKK